MPVLKRKATRGYIYWISFKWKGKRVFERSGTDVRAARSLLAKRKQETRDGTYSPNPVSGATTVGQWVGAWLDARTNRNNENEVAQVRRHALAREWFASMTMRSVDVPDAKRLVIEIKESTSEKTGKTLSWKSTTNIHGTLRTAFRDALEQRIVDRNPFILPRETLHRRKGAVERVPYTRAEVETLCTDKRIPERQRVWNTLAFFTGMREGEVCGRTWADWDRDARPLGALRVHSQYDGQVLKTAKEAGEHARRVPVHPFLAATLAAWKERGFEETFGRLPQEHDPIVPSLDGSHYTRWAIYNAWRRTLAAVGVRNRSVHATRHTFVTLCRRGGAPEDIVEKITHNAKGSIVDVYTHFDWSPLCRAVAVLGGGDDGGDAAIAINAVWMVPAQGFEPILDEEPPGNSEEPPGRGRARGLVKIGTDRRKDAKGDGALPSLHSAELSTYDYADRLALAMGEE